MNERIQELAEQAGFYVAGNKIYIPSTSEDITSCQTKFAEMIVRECMAVGFAAVATIDDGCHAVDVYDRIKDHFGVKE